MSLVGSPEKTAAWLRQRWPAIRGRGLAHFLLAKGVLVWGGIMFVLMLALVIGTLGTGHPRLPLLIGIAAILCACGGAFWAAVTWWLNEKFFRSLESKNTP